jgi:hypothetical protein
MMSCLSVISSAGSYRSTLHPYKLLFQMKTKVKPCENPAIPLYGFSFTELADVCSHTSEYDFLIGTCIVCIH